MSKKRTKGDRAQRQADQLEKKLSRRPAQTLKKRGTMGPKAEFSKFMGDWRDAMKKSQGKKAGPEVKRQQRLRD
jgi:hypothetical protein